MIFDKLKKLPKNPDNKKYFTIGGLKIKGIITHREGRIVFYKDHDGDSKTARDASDAFKDYKTGIEEKNDEKAILALKEEKREINNCGIATPEMEIKLGGEKGSLCIITDFVKGKNMEEIEKKTKNEKQRLFSGERREDIVSCVDSLFSYLEKRIKENKPFLEDIFGLDQFVLGKTKNDKKLKIYLVDFEPYLLNPENSNKSFKTVINSLDNWISFFDVFGNNDLSESYIIRRNKILSNLEFKVLGEEMF